jgi:Galactose oxidase, central domain
MVLEDNTADDLPITANGTFTFKTAVTGAYAVTIKTQPSTPTQNCTVANGSGTATTNVTNVQINCGQGLTVSGSISGLIGGGLVLQLNGGDNFSVSGTGNVTFTFSQPVAPGANYAVTVSTPPTNPTQACFVSNGTGTVSGNVTNIQVTCSQPSFTIGGSVVGMVLGPGDTMELQDNAGDDLFVTGDTTFTFPTQVTYGGIFNVFTFLSPTSNAPLACNDFYYTGIAIADVDTVIVDCQHNDWNWVTDGIQSTETANSTGAVTMPLFPTNSQTPPDLGAPGSRDFAMAWTDGLGQKWIFGGKGWAFPSGNTVQAPGLLSDLWVYDGSGPFSSAGTGWVPANLSTFINKAGDWQYHTDPLSAIFAPSSFSGGGLYAGPYPGGRWGGVTWTQSTGPNQTGNLWMFGGEGDGGLMNEVWEWIPGNPPNALPAGSSNNAGTYSGQWVSHGGGVNLAGVYGTKGTGSTTNLPGGRWAAASATDGANANVYLFGGQGFDSAGSLGLLSDLWKYNIASGQWTWVAGPSLVNTNGVYGTKGSATGGTPGSRQAASMWVDTSGNVWLFGGFGLDSAGTGIPAGGTPQGAILNDLWEFTGGQWVWISGGNIANQTGVYGTAAISNLSTGAAGNVPGSRWGAAAWSDAHSNLWIYGGWGYGSVTTDPTGFLNDIWEYQQSSGQWIWWKGTTNVNQNGLYSIPELAQGLPFVKYVTGGRRGASVFKPDSEGYVWVFGGEGVDVGPGNPPGYLNDLWMYLPFLN